MARNKRLPRFMRFDSGYVISHHCPTRPGDESFYMAENVILDFFAIGASGFEAMENLKRAMLACHTKRQGENFFL